MPYIIKVTHPRPNEPHGDWTEADDNAEAHDVGRAVATIEEAREAAKSEICERDGFRDRFAYNATINAGNALPEAGGTIGPLPDGSMVEVQQVCWNWIIGMADDAGIDTETVHMDAPSGKGDLAILDAYNEYLER